MIYILFNDRHGPKIWKLSQNQKAKIYAQIPMMASVDCRVSKYESLLECRGIIGLDNSIRRMICLSSGRNLETIWPILVGCLAGGL